ncbi:Uncharacterized protein OS=Isosphaera pallida (strain ATCC 43644 / DSM 9630 / IS1B) GN=Isop_1313 PE=4 SV=1 [Gemmata massiliana]|uniref:Uncharacterized protein n=1 Tax=Gemmata massiliana TaxID=1210884 RepID=A0A6P2DC61_9BACT|nr:hypothetical protein [Gemmata massiliana]VTR98864.1 Uncharacterized protein OS=Isosphaera pallida (strain ATCC 43644 / DSM 9630 / IS1B) GN=Isop_1313 PE=4 SV=1 [Gemmata massiliana]
MSVQCRAVDLVKIKQGMRGLLVHDRKGAPVVFLICQPATRYYRVMTRSEWMTALVGEVILSI